MPDRAELTVPSHNPSPAVDHSHFQGPVKFGLEREDTVFQENIINALMRRGQELRQPDTTPQ